jgi:hypothetical protein
MSLQSKNGGDLQVETRETALKYSGRIQENFRGCKCHCKAIESSYFGSNSCC